VLTLPQAKTRSRQKLVNLFLERLKSAAPECFVYARAHAAPICCSDKQAEKNSHPELSPTMRDPESIAAIVLFV